MKPKSTVKIIVDVGMTVLLLLLMAYHLTGDVAHEWMGAAMFLLFLLHHLLNLQWYRGLLRGRYTPQRALATAVNLLLVAVVVGMVISGVLLSRHVFAGLGITGGRSFGRSLHHVCAYWGFVLLSAHLGLHGSMLLGLLRKTTGKGWDRVGTLMLRGIAALVAGYGLYAFLKNSIGLYMFNLVEFAFFDYDRLGVLFFGEYLAIMSMVAILFYYLNALLGAARKGKQKRNV